jgi:putative ABC transport system permease protein
VFVSLEEEIAQELGVELGDEIVFDVQGVPISTSISSLRAVNWQRISPNFFVIFPTGVLEDAPQFSVFVTRTDSQAVSAAFQQALVHQFPNVSVVDLQLVVTTVRTLLDKVSLVIRSLALLSVVTGLLVLLGVMSSSRYQRRQESVLLRTLGAMRYQVERIMFLEYLFLGGFAALTGVLLAIGGTWALTYFVFQVEFTLSVLPALIIAVLVCICTVLVGILSNKGIHNHPPLEILRTEG